MLSDVIIDTAAESIVSVDEDWRIIAFNRMAEEVFGYTRNEVIGNPLDMLISPNPEDPDEGLVSCSIASGTEAPGMCANRIVYGLRRDGIQFPAETSMSTVEVGKSKISTIIVRDVTQRVRSEQALRESEQRFRQLVEQAANLFVLCDQYGRYVEVNEEMCKVLGYSREELLEMSVADVAINVTTENLEESWETLLTDSAYTGRTVVRRKDGTTFPVEFHTRLIELGGHKFRLALAHDLTEWDRAEESIKASLREKEVLLKEINHRVKNSLQVASSLLSLQAHKIQDSTLRNLLQESQDRIKAMALIHEKLYDADDLAAVDFGCYMRSLIDDLFTSYAIDEGSVELNLDADLIFLAVDVAIPCGLIVNELISNSLKHAFIPSQRGEIKIQMEEQGETYSLVVGDSGSGFPEGFDMRGSTTMGLRLVNALVDQLKGTVELVSRGGTQIKINFPKSQR